MKKRDRDRMAKRWAWERIIEALEGLRLTEWPFDDKEFEAMTPDERRLCDKFITENISYLKSQYVKKG